MKALQYDRYGGPEVLRLRETPVPRPAPWECLVRVHAASLNPADWKSMVDETRLLERALGSADKFIAGNEEQTAVVQRRCLRAARDIRAGEILTRQMIDVLRPAALGAIKPDQIPQVIGTRALGDIPLGRELRWTDLGSA